MTCDALGIQRIIFSEKCLRCGPASLYRRANMNAHYENKALNAMLHKSYARDNAMPNHIQR